MEIIMAAPCAGFGDADNPVPAGGDRTLRDLVAPRWFGDGVDYAAILERCRTHPEEASQAFSVAPVEVTVLHVLLAHHLYDPPEEVVAAVAGGHPQAIAGGADLETPLEIALRRELSPNIIHTLVEIYFNERHRRGGDLTTDWYRDLVPRSDRSGEALRAILEASPEPGTPPLFARSFSFLANQRAAAMTTTTTTQSRATAVIRILLEERPDAARVPDPLTQELPLYMAARNGWPCEEILAAEPRALLTRSVRDRLYPVQAAMLRWADLGGQSTSSLTEEEETLGALNSAYSILREEPSLL